MMNASAILSALAGPSAGQPRAATGGGQAGLAFASLVGQSSSQASQTALSGAGLASFRQALYATTDLTADVSSTGNATAGLAATSRAQVVRQAAVSEDTAPPSEIIVSETVSDIAPDTDASAPLPGSPTDAGQDGETPTDPHPAVDQQTPADAATDPIHIDGEAAPVDAATVPAAAPATDAASNNAGSAAPTAAATTAQPAAATDATAPATAPQAAAAKTQAATGQSAPASDGAEQAVAQPNSSASPKQPPAAQTPDTRPPAAPDNQAQAAATAAQPAPNKNARPRADGASAATSNVAPANSGQTTATTPDQMLNQMADRFARFASRSGGAGPAPAAEPAPAWMAGYGDRAPLAGTGEMLAGGLGTLRSHPVADPAVAVRQPAGTPNAAQAAVDQVGLAISRAVQDGRNQFTIRLDPPELGRVEVRLEFQAEGAMRATVTADQRDTLTLLQRDAQSLERALQQAGVKTDSGSLNFTLNHDGQRGAEQSALAQAGSGEDDGQTDEAAGDGEPADGEVGTAPAGSGGNGPVVATSNGLIDVKV